MTLFLFSPWWWFSWIMINNQCYRIKFFSYWIFNIDLHDEENDDYHDWNWMFSWVFSFFSWWFTRNFSLSLSLSLLIFFISLVRWIITCIQIVTTSHVHTVGSWCWNFPTSFTCWMKLFELYYYYIGPSTTHSSTLVQYMNTHHEPSWNWFTGWEGKISLGMSGNWNNEHTMKIMHRMIRRKMIRMMMVMVREGFRIRERGGR